MEIFPAPFFVLLNFLICKIKHKICWKILCCSLPRFPSNVKSKIVFSSKFVRWMDLIYCKIFSHLSLLGDLWIAACSLQTPFSVTSALFHKEILENTELMKIQKKWFWKRNIHWNIWGSNHWDTAMFIWFGIVSAVLKEKVCCSNCTKVCRENNMPTIFHFMSSLIFPSQNKFIFNHIFA